MSEAESPPNEELMPMIHRLIDQLEGRGQNELAAEDDEQINHAKAKMMEEINNLLMNPNEPVNKRLCRWACWTHSKVEEKTDAKYQREIRRLQEELAAAQQENTAYKEQIRQLEDSLIKLFRTYFNSDCLNGKLIEIFLARQHIAQELAHRVDAYERGVLIPGQHPENLAVDLHPLPHNPHLVASLRMQGLNLNNSMPAPINQVLPGPNFGSHPGHQQQLAINHFLLRQPVDFGGIIAPQQEEEAEDEAPIPNLPPIGNIFNRSAPIAARIQDAAAHGGRLIEVPVPLYATQFRVEEATNVRKRRFQE